MNSSLDILNRLLAIHCRSLPQYLRWSRPYAPAGSRDAMDVLTGIAHDQDGLAERISRMIIDLGGLPRTGEFPMMFTDLHDLDLEFLVATAEQCQEQDVESIARLAVQAEDNASVKAIAEEALGMAKGHLETLRELRQAAPAG